MPRRLLVNADDFGLTPGINQAIVELHQAGALASATLMATGPAFQNAVSVARRNGGLHVGCHVVLTDGIPVLTPEAIPSLCGRGSKQFRPSLLGFVVAVLLGRVREAEIAAEAEAQIHKLEQAGIHVTHVDTHKHTHVLPLVSRALTAAMERTGVRAMRNPFEPEWSARLSPGLPLRRLQLWIVSWLRTRFSRLPALREGRIVTTDGTIGVSATGYLDRGVLQALLRHMPEGTWELVCHPGYNDADLDRVTTRLRGAREVEKAALLQELCPLPAEFTVIHYGDL